MITRNAFDEEIVRNVIVKDEYRLQKLHAAGEQVRLAIDIGGHIGSATRAIKALWPESKIIAAEPSPDSAELFRRNTADLSRVHLHQIAIVPVGGSRQIQLFDMPDGNPAARYTAPTELPTNSDPVASDIINLLSVYGSPDIDLLKLDAEGPEAAILIDLQNAGYLPRVRHIVGEYHGREQVPLIRQALAETHTLEIYEHDWPWGSFFAHLKAQLPKGQQRETGSLSGPRSGRAAAIQSRRQPGCDTTPRQRAERASGVRHPAVQDDGARAGVITTAACPSG